MITRLLAFTSFLCLAAATQAVAQNSSPVPEGGVRVEEAGRDKQGDEPYDTPELYGATPYELGKGARLPAAVAEYSVRSGKVLQRISLFDNGVVALHLHGAGPDLYRRLVMPADTFETIRTLVGRIDSSSIERASSDHRENSDYAELRFRRDGVPYRMLFGAAEVVPQSVEVVRIMLGDLFTSISEDHQVANPLNGYQPKVGDRLVSDDNRLYRVTRVLGDGTLVELENTTRPMHLYLPTNMLYKVFVSVRATSTP